MSPKSNRFCPYCFSALVGVVILIGIPQLADFTTPFGKASLILFWIPLISACIRSVIRQGPGSQSMQT